MTQNKIKFIFKAFLLFIVLAAVPVTYAADTASILPPAKTTFFDQNGKPLTSGKVYFYIPGTTTFKTTWQDAAETIPNLNPVVLDGAGRAIVLGSGAYRQVVVDKNNNPVWDQVTSSAGSGGSGTVTVGDGLAVGTVIAVAGLVTPSSTYAFTYGQELSRITYASLLTILTKSQNVTCASGSPIITSVSDTSQINIGAAIEASCLPAATTVLSKTANTLTLNNNALVSTTVTAIMFPYGNGNGITTFNIPDYRGVDLTGRCNMGGANCSVINSTYYTDPNSLNGSGGAQTTVISIAQTNLPSVNFATSVSGTVNVNGTITVNSNVANLVSASSLATQTSVGGAQSVLNGAAINATVTSTGAGQTMTGGNTLTGNAASGGSGTAITVANIPPSKTVNYAIKIAPDVNLSIARCSNLIDAGTACTYNVGTSGATIPLLNTANTYSLNQTFASVTIAGGTITGMPNPSVGSDVANKAYVDSLASGLIVLPPTSVSTNTILPNSPVYNNGALGVGATLTAGSNGTLTVDGVLLATGSGTLLVRNQASGFQNGIYTITDGGSAGTPYILTRVTYLDQAAEMKAGSYTFITLGTVGAGQSRVLAAAVTTVGTDPLTWNLFSSNTTVTINPTFTANNFGGRLTLVSGNPYVTTDQIAVTNLYYAPVSGAKYVPIKTGGIWSLYSILSGSTDQVGLTLALAGSANWAPDSIHDVFVINDAGVTKLATRLWDAGMYPTEVQIPNVTAITTNTGANAWTGVANAFNGTVVQPMASSARIPVPSNTGLINCIGQDWGVGVTKNISSFTITASSDNFLQGGGSPTLPLSAYGSNDNVNFEALAFPYVDATANGTSYNIPINESYQSTGFRYVIVCITGNAAFSINVAQLQFFNKVAPAAGRRLTLNDGIRVNDAVMTARTAAGTTVSVPQYEGSFVGIIHPSGNGALTAHVGYGSNRTYDFWNAYNQVKIKLQASVPSFVSSYVLTAQRWQIAQSGFSLKVIQGLAGDSVPATLFRGFYIDTAGGRKAYEAGIAVDNTISFSGTQVGATMDVASSGANGYYQVGSVDLYPFAGIKTLNVIERTDSGAGSVSPFTDMRSTKLTVEWKG